MLHYGNKNRTQHPTDANAESSRSHAVFQVIGPKAFLSENSKGYHKQIYIIYTYYVQYLMIFSGWGSSQRKIVQNPAI